MQSNTYIRPHSTLLTLAGLALVGTLSACGGGSSQASAKSPVPFIDPVIPPVTTTQFDRIGLDVQLFSNTAFNSTGGQLGATLGSGGNITIKNLDQQLPDHPVLNYNFTFSSGSFGGPLKGNLVTFVQGGIDKEINLLSSGTTKNVQNVFWRGQNDPTLFGFGAVGYAHKLNAKNWPISGTGTFKGKAFQYIVDSNVASPSDTTYALYTSDVTASVDYLVKTISIAIAPNPTFLNSSGDPAVTTLDQSQLAANYVLTDLNLSGDTAIQRISDTQSKSGLGLFVKEDALTFFGNNAEELGGFVRYSGDVNTPKGVMTRDQFVSFSLVKQ